MLVKDIVMSCESEELEMICSGCKHDGITWKEICKSCEVSRPSNYEARDEQTEES